ncbi:hypothetical protein ACVDHJ_20170, partial [Aeromonas sp. 25-281]
ERSHWSGNGVHVEPESVFMIGRNMHHHRLNGIEENAQLPPSQGDRYPISKFRVALFEDKGKNFSILSSRELKLKPAVPSASYTSPML